MSCIFVIFFCQDETTLSPCHSFSRVLPSPFEITYPTKAVATCWGCSLPFSLAVILVFSCPLLPLSYCYVNLSDDVIVLWFQVHRPVFAKASRHGLLSPPLTDPFLVVVLDSRLLSPRSPTHHFDSLALFSGGTSRIPPLLLLAM